jgi:hypothetical protein
MPRYSSDRIEEINKIDLASANGLLGTNNSLAYRTGEVERHIHSNERWFGAAAIPNAEIHVADRIGNGITPLRIDSGNLVWGNWIQILGSSDTPASPGNTKFDVHEIQMTGNERNSDYFIQIGFGVSGAAALAAGTYTEKALTFDGANVEKFFVITARRHDVGSKVWARCVCPADTGTLDFYVGLHEYEG